jgi:hypothetical protein
MKKMVFIGFGAIIVITTALGIFLYSVGDNRVMNMKFIGIYTVDMTGIREWFEVKDGTPFTCFLQIKDSERNEEYFAKQFGLNLSCIDFEHIGYQDKYLVISFGRELVEIKYEYLGKPYAHKTIARADITFAEDYHDQQIYLYAVDKVLLTSSVVGGNAFYVIDGSDKRYWGDKIFDLNTRIANDEKGF